jgi:hypothetical protein
MSAMQELRTLLDDLKKKVRQDQNVSGAIYDALVIASADLEDALVEMEKAKQVDEAKVRMLYESAQRLSLMLEEIKRSWRRGYPSYIDDFVPSIAVAPYTMPRTLYESQGAEQISINVEGQLNSERAELALATLFPGSTTYRYAAPPVKIRTGRWFRSGRARLSSVHELSPKPEFELKMGDRTFRVYKPITLRAFRMHGPRAVCTSCLSLSDGDENCGHSTLQFRAKLPSSYPIIRRVELSRTATENKTLQSPMFLLVPKVTFLSELEVGLALVGFERIATVRGVSRAVRVDYDPPIGVRLMTSGLSFKVNIPRGFGKQILDSNPMLRRDMILNFLSATLAGTMSNVGLPSYYHELLLSSLIAVVGLDNLVDEKTVLERLRSETLISDVNSALNRELEFYESGPPDVSMVENVLTALQALDITEDKLRMRLRKTILHSLAHVFLLAAAVTSGSQLDDLDYLVKEESEEVVVFDAVSGGNGSSEAAFEFLSEPGKFSIKEYLESEEREEIYRPRNFDETAFEFLLPCINGVADRVFFFGKVQPLESEINRKLNELRDKETTHERAIRRIREYGNTRIFPIGIGYHAVDYSNRPHEADRFREAANICLHGCPECISIGRKCHLGSFYEKYGISKLVLDDLLNNLIQEVTISKPSPSQILDTLSKHGFVVIKGSCDEQHACQKLVNNLNAQVLELVGQEVNEGRVKFAGHWVNMDFASGELKYYFMLKVI